MSEVDHCTCSLHVLTLDVVGDHVDVVNDNIVNTCTCTHVHVYVHKGCYTVASCTSAAMGHDVQI